MNETLKVLKLDGNKLKRFGGLALADALQVNTTLEELNLNNTEQVNVFFILRFEIFLYVIILKHV